MPNMTKKPVLAVIDDFLDNSILIKLLESFDSFRWDDNYSQKGIRKSIVFNRSNYLYNVRINPIIVQIKDFIFSHKNILSKINRDQTEWGLSNSIIEKFLAKYIRNFLYKIHFFKKLSRNARRLFFGDKYKITFSLNYTNGSYDEAPHLDQRNKILVGLIYLDDTNSNDSSNLIFWENKSSNLNYDQSLYIKDSDLSEFINVQQKRNRLVLFKNDNNAIHSAKGNLKGKRRFIYFSIVSSRQINLY